MRSFTLHLCNDIFCIILWGTRDKCPHLSPLLPLDAATDAGNMAELRR